ncbi:MAG: GNAT family N-acetyltransferase [Propionibacteriaceae bacterium]
MTDHAPGFVRLALPREAYGIASIQYDLMADPAHPLHGLYAQTDVDALAEVWHRSILRPPLASYRVLVATEHETVVGMVAVGPSEDEDAGAEDGQVIELMVRPPERSRGHGTRLVQAAVDTLRADGFTRATWWLPSTADELRAWLQDMGWAPDGIHASAEGPAGRVKLVRLHTDISAS